MPDEWKETTLGEHVDVATGEAFKSARFGTLPESGTLLARGDNVKEGEFEFGDKARYWPEFTPDLERYLLREGDVLIGMDGSKVGKNWVRVQKKDLPCLLVQRVARLRAKETMDQWFLRYLIGNPQFKNYVERIKTGTTIPHISGGQIKSYDILLPPVVEQTSIAAILGALDEKIELNRRMNETLEALAQTIFKSWFVDATATKLPKGWRAGTLGEVAENPRRSIQPDEIKSSMSYIGLEHMPRRSIALSEWESDTNLGSNKLEFKHGEILFGKLRPYFHKVGVAPLDGVCSTDILVVRPKTPEWFGFVLGHVSSVELVNHTDAASTGTKMPRTNWNDLARFEVALPPESLAAEFTATIRPMIDRIIANIHESRTLAELRDALLPKLLSGELRVPASLERNTAK